MAAADKDLAELRREHKELSDYSGRLAIVFLTVLTLLGISFSRAWNRVQSEEVKNLVCQIHLLNEQNVHSRYDCDIEVSYVFGNYLKIYDDVDWKNHRCPCPKLPEASPTPTPTATPTPTPVPEEPACKCQTKLDQEAKDEEERRLEETMSSYRLRGLPTPSPVRGSDDPVCQCQKKFQDQLEGKAAAWFTTKPPIPGVDVTIDLRAWVFALPVLFSLCGLYLYILRKKQNFVWAVGNQRLRESEVSEVTELDRLFFEGDAPYQSFPSKLTTSLVFGFYLFMPVYVAYRAWVSWDSGGGAILLFLPLAVFCMWYAIAYGWHVAGKFDEQLESITEIRRHRQTSWLDWLGRTLNPVISLVTGSVLVLITLTLPVIKESLRADKSFSGYALILRRTANLWVTVTPDLQAYYPQFAHIIRVSANLGWAIYLSSLLLAILIILLLLSPARSLLMSKWIRAIGLLLTSVILAFLIIEFFIGIAGLLEVRDTSVILAKLVVFLVTVGLICVSAWKSVGSPSQRQKNARTMVALYLPALLVSFGFLIWLQLPGLIALLAGILLMTLGFFSAQYRADLAKRGPVVTVNRISSP